ncbi:MAG: response regulator [Rhodospirillales bacterium]|nr:response regulator [Rhodospirillales bacterium]
MSVKVLIVEDDVFGALGMADVATLAGYEVIGLARRVSEAVEMATAVHPDIAVFDIRLAGRRDGIEGAGILKEMGGTAVVFITAEADEGALERAEALEPVAFLPKPCPPRDLLSALQVAAGADPERDGQNT